MSNSRTPKSDTASDVPDYGAKLVGNDRGTPANQERVLTDEERHEKAPEDTFTASDPIPPSRINGPTN